MKISVEKTEGLSYDHPCDTLLILLTHSKISVCNWYDNLTFANQNILFNLIDKSYLKPIESNMTVVHVIYGTTVSAMKCGF